MCSAATPSLASFVARTTPAFFSRALGTMSVPPKIPPNSSSTMSRLIALALAARKPTKPSAVAVAKMPVVAAVQRAEHRQADQRVQPAEQARERGVQPARA